MVGISEQMIVCRIARNRNLIRVTDDNCAGIRTPAGFKFLAKIVRRGAFHPQIAPSEPLGGLEEVRFVLREGKLPSRQRALSESGYRAQGGEPSLLFEPIEIPFAETILDEGRRIVRQCQPSVTSVLGNENGDRIRNLRGWNHAPRATRQAQENQGRSAKDTTSASATIRANPSIGPSSIAFRDSMIETRLNKTIQKADWQFPSLNDEKNLHGPEFSGQHRLG